MFTHPTHETPSLEALQAYGLASKVQVAQGDNAGSVPIYERAISLDPNFALAYASLGATYYNLGETALAAKNASKGFELRDRVSEAERLGIESRYHHFVTGDLGWPGYWDFTTVIVLTALEFSNERSSYSRRKAT